MRAERLVLVGKMQSAGRFCKHQPSQGRKKTTPNKKSVTTLETFEDEPLKH